MKGHCLKNLAATIAKNVVMVNFFFFKCFRFRYFLQTGYWNYWNTQKSNWCKAIKLCDFKMDLIKWQLNFVSCNFWSEIILVISNRTRPERSFDFEITRAYDLDLIKFILKSLVILAIWLALSGAIYLRIAPFFALNRIFFSANENRTVKQNNQSDSVRLK